MKKFVRTTLVLVFTTLMKKILLALIFVTMAFHFSSAKEPSLKYTTIMMDDGPSENTERLLKILKEKNVTINFNLIAKNVVKHPEEARMIAESGNIINCHSLTHTAPADLTDEQLRDEIVKGKQVIEEITGKKIYWYWPPYLSTTPRMDPYLKEAGMKLCRFDGVISCEDYNKSVTGDQIRERVINGAKDGSLILLHEWRDATLEQLPAIIDALRAKGFVFVPYAQWYQYRFVLPNEK